MYTDKKLSLPNVKESVSKSRKIQTYPLRSFRGHTFFSIKVNNTSEKASIIATWKASRDVTRNRRKDKQR